MNSPSHFFYCALTVNLFNRIDLFGTVLSVICNYSTPFFLKYLLDEISLSYPNGRGRAYLYAFLLFAFKILKSETDLQRLWCARRAAIRIRSELMSMIFMKSLKRKDVKVTVKKTDSSSTGSADTGKVMNLMSEDTGKISTCISTISLLYGSPFEIIVACAFLTQLLGVAVLVGLSVMIICWPLNTIFAHQTVRIKRRQLAARDRRVDILNELLAAIKLVKFQAWEGQWAKRVLDSRAVELVILIQFRCLKILMELLWAAVPIAISVLTFYAYVAQGNELTIGTTFAAIALFNMLKIPLSNISTRFVEVLQAYVSLKRIEGFLNEEEVSAHASRLTTNGGETVSSPNLEIRDASFTWNRSKKDPNNDEDQEIRVFQLRDLSISFPSGKLSVVTGPTASGKTALLVIISKLLYAYHDQDAYFLPYLAGFTRRNDRSSWYTTVIFQEHEQRG